MRSDRAQDFDCEIDQRTKHREAEEREHDPPAEQALLLVLVAHRRINGDRLPDKAFHLGVAARRTLAEITPASRTLLESGRTERAVVEATGDAASLQKAVVQ